MSELVHFLLSIPFVLPGVLSESRVVPEAVHEEVTSGDRVVDGESSGVSDSIRVRRELSALEEESTGIRVFFNGSLTEFNHTGFNLGGVDLSSLDDSFESGNILGSIDPVSILVHLDTTLVLDEVVHGLKSDGRSSHDNNLFFD